LGGEDAAIPADSLAQQSALVFLQAEDKLVVHGDALSILKGGGGINDEKKTLLCSYFVDAVELDASGEASYVAPSRTVLGGKPYRRRSRNLQQVCDCSGPVILFGHKGSGRFLRKCPDTFVGPGARSFRTVRPITLRV
jgi:hypothetical protein